MKSKNTLLKLGIVIYIILASVDKFVVSIPHIVFIPCALLGIVLILIGFSKKK